MAARKKPKPPTAAQLARERARALQGPTPPSRTIPDERRRPDKHKPDWTREAEETEPPA